METIHCEGRAGNFLQVIENLAFAVWQSVRGALANARLRNGKVPLRIAHDGRGAHVGRPLTRSRVDGG